MQAEEWGVHRVTLQSSSYLVSYQGEWYSYHRCAITVLSRHTITVTGTGSGSTATQHNIYTPFLMTSLSGDPSLSYYNQACVLLNGSWSCTWHSHKSAQVCTDSNSLEEDASEEELLEHILYFYSTAKTSHQQQQQKSLYQSSYQSQSQSHGPNNNNNRAQEAIQFAALCSALYRLVCEPIGLVRIGTLWKVWCGSFALWWARTLFISTDKATTRGCTFLLLWKLGIHTRVLATFVLARRQSSDGSYCFGGFGIRISGRYCMPCLVPIRMLTWMWQMGFHWYGGEKKRNDPSQPLWISTIKHFPSGLDYILLPSMMLKHVDATPAPDIDGDTTAVIVRGLTTTTTY